MAIQGLRDTSNFVTNQRPENWREGIMLLYPNGKTPLLGMTSMMKSRSVDDFTYNWWEKSLNARRVALAANIASTSVTTFTLASGATIMKEGDILLVEESGELVVLTADPTSDTALVVQRGFAGTTAATVTFAGAGVNPNLSIVGSAHEQGSLAPTGIGYDPNQQYNYTQIFRNTLEATRTAMKTRLRTGDSIKEAKRECLEYHGIDMEKSFLFGKRFLGTKNGKPWATTGGVEQSIPAANLLDGAGATGIDMETLETWLELIFREGSSEKMWLGGNASLLAIQQIVRKNSSIQITSGIKEFGMNVTRLTSPFGELVCKTHPLMNQMTGGTTGGTAYYGVNSWAFIMDMANIGYTHLTDSDTKYEPDLQVNGMDGLKSGYLTEAGLELHHASTHFLVKNLVKGIADT